MKNDEGVVPVRLSARDLASASRDIEAPQAVSISEDLTIIRIIQLRNSFVVELCNRFDKLAKKQA